MIPKPNLKVTKCCDDNDPFYYEVDNQGGITLAHTGDGDYNIDNVRFCMFCGKRLEVYPEDPSKKIQAFEELKMRMEKDERLRYARLGPADKAKHDLKVEMIEDDKKKRRKK